MMQTQKHHALQFDAIVQAPFGAVGIAKHGQQITTELLFGDYAPKVATDVTVKQLAEQIMTYFKTASADFDLPLPLNGTPYQQRVWQAIRAIPMGKVLTYQQLAQQLGSGARAVANACGANHLPLFVPCHRVIAKNGLGGFMRGDPNGHAIKTCLLKHEGVQV